MLIEEAIHLFNARGSEAPDAWAYVEAVANAS
jgi:hypothetical protein